ncbi:MAG: hypothetical protein DWQ47_01130 [Acidobacteria bacterium]|nr:MAG: hypothetical protein DWQ32_11590 [Acidobacteriota bacterium]REK04104.1 MAG: hypothetical protein DWQ38_01115 [Acidobacteriota bacterium]REK15266.1 MAG: hypothetical protein DWQ43_17280 [Acidobacteriota bacterium]REK46356.1 MAG: hypothetical protein DWQ47_01130 [Acidobacteriota bacterium]
MARIATSGKQDRYFPVLRRSSFNISLILLALLIVAGLSGCEEQADVRNSVEYKKDGIAFRHPGNWTVTEDIEDEVYRYLALETPGASWFVIHVYDKDEALELDDFVDHISDSMQAELEFGEVEERDRSAIDRMIAGTTWNGVYEMFSYRTFGLSQRDIHEYYRVETETEVYFLISGAPEEDLWHVTPGFNQIYASIEFKSPAVVAETPRPEATPEPEGPKPRLRHEKMKKPNAQAMIPEE